jgi:hypothetical protein
MRSGLNVISAIFFEAIERKTRKGRQNFEAKLLIAAKSSFWKYFTSEQIYPTKTKRRQVPPVCRTFK